MSGAVVTECVWCHGSTDVREAPVPITLGRHTMDVPTTADSCERCAEWYAAMPMLESAARRAARVMLLPEFAGVVGGLEVRDICAWCDVGHATLAERMGVSAPVLEIWLEQNTLPREVIDMVREALVKAT